MENKKIYVGKAKYHEFSNGNKIAKIWITPDGLQLINENRSQNGSINLVMSEMRNPDRANNTHTLYVDIRRKPNEGGFTTGFEAQQASASFLLLLRCLPMLKTIKTGLSLRRIWTMESLSKEKTCIGAKSSTSNVFQDLVTSFSLG